MFTTPNHPLIVLGQAVLTVLLFVHFFKVQHKSWPVRLAYGTLPFTVLANLLARIGNLCWFEYSDIALFWAWPLASVVKIFSFPTVTSYRTPDVFDRYRTQLLCAVVVVVVGLVGWGYVREREEKNVALAETDIAVKQENTRVTAEFARQQQEAEAQRDTIGTTVQAIATGLASVSATQQTLIVGQNQLAKKVTPARSPARKPQKRKPEFETIEGRPFSPQINRPVIAPAPEPKKEGFFKRLFGSRQDSLSVYPDTLARY